ncbi:hypothetical protein [Aeromicrobium sp. UC242_57]|uniref:hypothetical protein n=1 Tax=Aeromicrobium sp. UC242_57 TaxID=3374624 RepID=UPI003787DD19
MSEDFTVVIWGAGALGFGLVGALAYEAGHEVVAVVRHSTTNKAKADRVESLQTRHRYTVGDADPRVVRLAKVIRNDTTQGRTALDRLLRTRKNILFCTTARAGQSDAVPIIERAREERRRDGNPGVLLLAPCENEVASPLAALKVSLAGPGFGYLDSMVDRICFEPVSRSGLVHVSCEPGYEWAYGSRAGSAPRRSSTGWWPVSTRCTSIGWLTSVRSSSASSG